MKILIADDDRVTRELLGGTLKSAGYEVLFAENGLDAVERASREKPDVVLMDGLMPKMHGFVACKTIKELEDPPKVVLLTGVYTKSTYKWEAKGTYLADGYLSKPFDRELLLALIEKLLLDLDRERSLLSLASMAALSCPPENPSHDSEKTPDLPVSSS
jgi:two-component system alkaline phosphatase synthesis response regulator PhoP